MQLTWNLPGKASDLDGDGIADRDDACPERAEDTDGYEDNDGCPDIDNDGDGVIDERDACPAEVAACDGCPVRDADNDGIMDDQDQCRDQAEDRDGFEDNDGCPDSDNDKDGIDDSADQCPDKPEDRDQFEDEDGCPDPDNDGDGIADDVDACPNRPGTADADGCPARKIERGRLILKGVHFESGKATLTPNSYSILDEVFQSLREWPDVQIEIRGYTDSVGSDAINKRLSRSRAASVRNYLTQKGIDPARIRATGYGEQDPIAPNATAEGRAQNRRVEMHRID
jgi:outer membrane protein OmpA-like peptidoglycan-associated protein